MNFGLVNTVHILSDDTRGWIVCGIPTLCVWTDYMSSSEEPHQAAQKQPGLDLRF